MHVKRFADAKPYEAVNHRNAAALRLQGFEPNGPKNQWVGLSQYLPGGGAGPDSTPFEKVYIVIEGEMSGLDLAQTLKTRAPDMAVVLMTGYSEALTRGAACGFIVLAKPFTHEEAAEAIRRARMGNAPSPLAPA